MQQSKAFPFPMPYSNEGLVDRIWIQSLQKSSFQFQGIVILYRAKRFLQNRLSVHNDLHWQCNFKQLFLGELCQPFAFLFNLPSLRLFLSRFLVCRPFLLAFTLSSPSAGGRSTGFCRSFSCSRQSGTRKQMRETVHLWVFVDFLQNPIPECADACVDGR